MRKVEETAMVKLRKPGHANPIRAAWARDHAQFQHFTVDNLKMLGVDNKVAEVIARDYDVTVELNPILPRPERPRLQAFSDPARWVEVILYGESERVVQALEMIANLIEDETMIVDWEIDEETLDDIAEVLDVDPTDGKLLYEDDSAMFAYLLGPEAADTFTAWWMER